MKPKLRFKEFTDEWKQTTLNDFFDISAGGDIEKKHVSEYKTDNYIYPIYANALTNNGLYGYSDIYKIDGKTITVTGRGDIGKAIARNGKYYPIVRLLVLKSKQEFNNIFFENAINNIKLFQESTGVPQLTSPQLGKYSVFFPNISEQDKIATLLSLLDKKIELQSKKIEDLKLFKKGLLYKEFTGKQKNKKLSDCFKFGKAGGTPKSTVKEYYDGVIPFLSISDMTSQGKYLEKTDKSISESGLNNSSAWLVPSNSLIISMYASYGLVSINKIDLTTSQAMFDMIIKDENDNEYIYYYLYYLYITNYYDSIVSTGTQPNLNAEQLKNLLLYIPTYEEQSIISKRFISLDKRINLETEKLNKLSELKKGLMQKMFV